MHLHDALARRLDPNAVAPYRWEAEYDDGTIVRQFDPTRGFQSSTRINAPRVKALRILGHPQAPVIRLEVPETEGPPDEVRIQASTDMIVPMGNGTPSVSVVRWFGFRCRARWYLVRIDDDARVMTTDRFE